MRSGWDTVTRGLQDKFPPNPALQFCTPKPMAFAIRALTCSAPNVCLGQPQIWDLGGSPAVHAGETAADAEDP